MIAAFPPDSHEDEERSNSLHEVYRRVGASLAGLRRSLHLNGYSKTAPLNHRMTQPLELP